MRAKNPDTVFCERVEANVLYQAYGNEVRVIALREDRLVEIRRRYPRSQRWNHGYENAVVRRYRNGETARRAWVELAPDTAITPPRDKRGKITPIMGETKYANAATG